MKQNLDESLSPDDLAEMDKRTQQLRDETSNLNAIAKSLRLTLGSINSTLSTADLHDTVANMEAERAEIFGRLTDLRIGTSQPVSKEEKDEVNKQAKIWQKKMMKRKRIVKDMWCQIQDSVPDAAQVEVLKVC